MLFRSAKQVQAPKDAEKEAKAARAKVARAVHKTLNTQLASPGNTSAATAGATQVSAQTASGGSLGSLSKYSLDWNLAETCEVSGTVNIPDYPPAVNPTAAELDASSSMTVGHRLYDLKASILSVDDSVEVSFPLWSFLCTRPSYMHSPSPRDLGWVICYLARISSLLLCI